MKNIFSAGIIFSMAGIAMAMFPFQLGLSIVGITRPPSNPFGYSR